MIPPKIAFITALLYIFWRDVAAITVDPFNNASMPCCLESLGISTCSRLKKRASWFAHKCLEDADFAIIQCCHTCRTNVQEVGVKLFGRGVRSPQCFDRHGPVFCHKFLQIDDRGRSRCSGANASFGFRLCRRSCGFCDPEIYAKNKRDDQCPIIG